MSVYVFHHGGALGDFVLCWPLLRALKKNGEVTLVTSREKGKLAAVDLAVEAVDSARREFAALWSDAAAMEGPCARMSAAVRVIAFVADAGSTWERNALAMFPEASVECIGGMLDRVRALELARRERGIGLRPDVHLERGIGLRPDGAVIGDTEDCSAAKPIARKGDATSGDATVLMHVGAGSESKRWAMVRWVAIAERLRARGAKVRLIAGEAEAERLNEAERRAFVGAGGRMLGTLAELADEIRGCGVFVAADSGPGHLAAQMGAKVVSLFGPTRPRLWAPIGKEVFVVAPSEPQGMSWLRVEVVEERLSEAIASP